IGRRIVPEDLVGRDVIEPLGGAGLDRGEGSRAQDEPSDQSQQRHSYFLARRRVGWLGRERRVGGLAVGRVIASGGFAPASIARKPSFLRGSKRVFGRNGSRGGLVRIILTCSKRNFPYVPPDDAQGWVLGNVCLLVQRPHRPASPLRRQGGLLGGGRASLAWRPPQMRQVPADDARDRARSGAGDPGWGTSERGSPA